MKLSCISSSTSFVPAFPSLSGWATVVHHRGLSLKEVPPWSQLGGGRGTCLRWSLSILQLLPPCARWPGVKVNSKRPQLLLGSLLSYSLVLNVEDSQGLGYPEQ